MRCLSMSICALLLTATGASALDQSVSNKKVSLPAEKDLIVGHQASQGRAILVELVPGGETVQNYSRMVTLQTAPDLGNVPENAFLQEFADRYTAACPKTTVTKVPMGQKGATGLRLDCPRHPKTNKLETVFVRAFDLGTDLGIVQITMRYFPMPVDGEWARDYLGRVTVQ